MSRYNIVSTIFLVLLIGSLALEGIFHFPLAWYVALIIVFSIINIFGAVILSSQYFVKVKYKGSDTSNAVALTFDDGPVEGKTEKILSVLDEYGAKATFFCIGKRVTKNPALLKAMHDSGHLIGNHSFFHGALFDLKSSTMITKELADTDNVIQHYIGKKPKFFRPPYGVTNPMVAKAVQRRNYTVIGWSIRSFDTVSRKPEKLLKKITDRIQPGDIVLFHEQSDSMLAILPDVLKHLQKVGLKVVRVDELLREKAYA